MKQAIQRYFYAGNSSLKCGHLLAAYENYIRLVKSFTLHKYGQNWPEKVYPEKNFIVNEEYSFIYVSIPKVACTSMKTMIFLLSHDPKELEVKNEILQNPSLVHISALKPFLLSNYSHQQAQKLIGDPKYFKFTVVRNPYSRLVSGYISKFVKNQDPNITEAIIEKIYQQKNLEPNYQKGITFRQFIYYLYSTGDRYLDEHWQSQHRILGGINLDFIAKFENLNDDFNYIKSKLNIPLDLAKINTTSYNQQKSKDSYADYYIDELKRLSEFPHSRSFYTPDLIELVKKRYRIDLEIFDYNFEEQHL